MYMGALHLFEDRDEVGTSMSLTKTRGLMHDGIPTHVHGSIMIFEDSDEIGTSIGTSTTFTETRGQRHQATLMLHGTIVTFEDTDEVGIKKVT